MEIAFIGLGVMGGPMARHLAVQGHTLRVCNRSAAKAHDWVAKHGGRAFEDPVEAARGAELVVLCVGNDDDVRGLLSGPGRVFQTMAAGAAVVDHTTTSAELARELAAEAMVHGVVFLDAPVSGGQAGAESGKLTVMAGGDPATLDRLRPVLSAYSKAITWIGPSGSGQLAKMVNQVCIAGVVQGLAEGLHFALRSGLDVERVLGAISAGAASSWQMENRGRTMAEGRFDFGFAVDLMRKDLGLVLDEARRVGARLDLTQLVDGYYAEIQTNGGRRWDTSSLITRLEKRPGGS